MYVQDEKLFDTNGVLTLKNAMGLTLTWDSKTRKEGYEDLEIDGNNLKVVTKSSRTNVCYVLVKEIYLLDSIKLSTAVMLFGDYMLIEVANGGLHIPQGSDIVLVSEADFLAEPNSTFTKLASTLVPVIKQTTKDVRDMISIILSRYDCRLGGKQCDAVSIAEGFFFGVNFTYLFSCLNSKTTILCKVADTCEIYVKETIKERNERIRAEKAYLDELAEDDEGVDAEYFEDDEDEDDEDEDY